MIKPKGGRGNKAPYETKLMRVPEPLASQVESLCQRYQDFLAGGGNPIEPPCFLIDLPKITEQLQSELSNLKIENEALPELETQPIMEMVVDDCPIEPSNDSGDFRKLLEYALKATPDNIKELAGELIKDAQKAIADKDTGKARNIRHKLKTDRKLVSETHLNPSMFVHALTSAEHEIWLTFHEKQPNYSFGQAYQDLIEVEQFKKTQTRKIFKLGLTNSDYREYKNLACIDRRKVNKEEIAEAIENLKKATTFVEAEAVWGDDLALKQATAEAISGYRNSWSGGWNLIDKLQIAAEKKGIIDFFSPRRLQCY